MGGEPLVEWENDKPTVVALREIADGMINARTLSELQKVEADSFFRTAIDDD